MTVSSWPDVDIVTVSYNSSRDFPEYFRALSQLDYPNHRLKLIIVDNASSDGSADLIARLMQDLPFASELVRHDRNLGFAGGCNLGAKLGHAPFILFLNPDTSVAPDMLRQLVDRCANETVVGLVDAAQEPVEVPKWRDPESNYTDWCSGAAALARREAFVQIGMFDTFFYPAYCEDVDLSWRMWLAGWKCVYERRARVEHKIAPTDASRKPAEVRYAIRFSFAMHFIYDTANGVGAHMVRGIRYLLSPRTERLRRRAVAEGLWTVLSSIPYLVNRRRSAQAALRESTERDRFVFTEWDYGRWMPQSYS